MAVIPRLWLQMSYGLSLIHTVGQPLRLEVWALAR